MLFDTGDLHFETCLLDGVLVPGSMEWWVANFGVSKFLPNSDVLTAARSWLNPLPSTALVLMYS